MGIESEEQVKTHYLKGGLVENLIISDLFKQYYNTARSPHVYFWRDNHGNEVDCIIEKGNMVFPIEIKAGQTVNSSYFSGLKFWNEIAENDPAQSLVVYTGKENQKRSMGNVFGWQTAGQIIKKIYQ